MTLSRNSNGTISLCCCPDVAGLCSWSTLGQPSNVVNINPDNPAQEAVQAETTISDGVVVPSTTLANQAWWESYAIDSAPITPRGSVWVLSTPWPDSGSGSVTDLRFQGVWKANSNSTQTVLLTIFVGSTQTTIDISAQASSAPNSGGVSGITFDIPISYTGNATAFAVTQGTDLGATTTPAWLRIAEITPIGINCA